MLLALLVFLFVGCLVGGLGFTGLQVRAGCHGRAAPGAPAS